MAVIGAIAAALLGAHGAWAANYVVDKPNDFGGEACTAAPSDCSLRSAIQKSNASAGTPDPISFNLAPAGAQVIAPATPLPQITDPAVVDGTTEPGYVGSPLVQLDGSSAGGGAIRLWITSGSTTVQGVSIVNWSFDGIRLESGDSNIIGNNWIGIDTAGLPAGNDGYGVEILNASNSNVVGGAIGNVISANGLGPTPFSGVGVFGAGTGGTVVSANYIGTDP